MDVRAVGRLRRMCETCARYKPLTKMSNCPVNEAIVRRRTNSPETMVWAESQAAGGHCKMWRKRR